MSDASEENDVVDPFAPPPTYKNMKVPRKASVGKNKSRESSGEDYFENEQVAPPPRILKKRSSLRGGLTFSLDETNLSDEEKKAPFTPPKETTKQPVTLRGEFGAKLDEDEKNLEEGSEVDAKEPAAFKSLSSMSSSKSSSRGRELNESWVFKFKLIFGVLFSLIINVLALVLVFKVYSDEGLIIYFGGSFFREGGGILFLAIMIGTYMITETTMKTGASAYFAAKLSDKKGYSLAACAFIQSNILGKLTLGSNLSFKSKVKKLMNRLGILWGIHTLSPIFAILAATQIHSATLRIEEGSLSCLIYHADGALADRKWPTAIVEMGIAEYVFGASLGILSSQDPVEKTTFVMAPQLIDTSDHGSTIVGQGLIHTIETNCDCAYEQEEEELVGAGVPPENFAAINSYIMELDSAVGLVNFVELVENRVIITSVLTGSAVCGRTNTTSVPVPVCKTAIYDPFIGKIQVTYMTDGSPASIAPERVEIHEYLEAYDIQWIEHGFKTLLGTTGYIKLPPTFPGSVNPMLWWTSPNMQVISPSLLEKGLETTFAMLSKAVIQRTYRTMGELCSKSVVATQYADLVFSTFGFVFSIIFIAFQLIANVASLLCFVPWFLSATPIFPAFRLLTDNFYMTVMTAKPALSHFTAELDFNANREVIVNALDSTLRMGESIFTCEDPERGELVLDKPKMVSHISNDKIYC
jgi:hypothetical protein